MIRVSILDDHELIRDGFSRLIDTQEDMQLSGSFSDGKSFLDKIQQIEVDILVLDINMPGQNGLELLKEIRTMRPELLVLILSMHTEEHYAVRALKNGASGFISKGSDSRVVLDAIRKIFKDGIYVSPSLSEKIAKMIQTPDSMLPHERLSKREFQVLCLIGEGKSTRDIADSLFISENTVRTHRKRIIDKMELHSTSELIQYAVSNELID